MKDNAYKYLKQFFGYDDFREGQKKIIKSILDGYDTLGVMPTGGGKSLCYQIPALCFKGITIVVSPLISLMKDQIDFLESIKYPAAMINSTVAYSRQMFILEQAIAGNIKLLYIAPERFRNETFYFKLQETDISLFAIDEAHCISEWGHDFRPEYRKLSAIIKHLGSPQIIALTATATNKVRDDIVKSLSMKNARIHISGFNRENLIYGVRHYYSKEDKKKDLINFIDKVSSPGIIYTSSIKEAEEVYNFIRTNRDYKTGIYHGSLDKKQRKIYQEDFLNNKTEILIATTAFGMGVNKSDIRFVIHYNIPGSIEAYYQETGRAGRDGKISYCLLMDYEADEKIQKFFITSKNPSLKKLETVLSIINKSLKSDLVYTDDLIGSADAEGINSFLLDTILKQLATLGCIETEFFSDSMVEILINKKRVDLSKSLVLEEILKLLDIYQKNASTNIKYLSTRCSLNRQEVINELKELKAQKIISYKINPSGRYIKLLKKSLTPDQKNEYSDKREKKLQGDMDKLQAVLSYTQLTNCRRVYLLNYFGEVLSYSNCKTCDICRGTYDNKSNIDLTENQIIILYFFLLNEKRFGKKLAAQILTGSYEISPKFRKIDEFGKIKNMNTQHVTDQINRLLTLKLIDYFKTGKVSTIAITDKGVELLKKNNKK